MHNANWVVVFQPTYNGLIKKRNCVNRPGISKPSKKGTLSELKHCQKFTWIDIQIWSSVFHFDTMQVEFLTLTSCQSTATFLTAWKRIGYVTSGASLWAQTQLRTLKLGVALAARTWWNNFAIVASFGTYRLRVRDFLVIFELIKHLTDVMTQAGLKKGLTDTNISRNLNV